MHIPEATDHFIDTNHIKLHYIEYKGKGPLVVLMHGLTANAHAFDGLVAAGLTKEMHLICPDLRGRGLTDKPAFNYTMQDHAADIIGLLDHLGVEKVILGGHSFGGLLTFYIAAMYPERVEKLIILDAAAQMNSKAAEMLSFAFTRFNVSYPSFADYLAQVKLAPYNTFWDDAMESYYRADVKDTENGHVHTRSNLTDIIEMSVGVANTSWPYIVTQIKQPTVLMNALDIYTLGEPLLPEHKAKETVALLADAYYVPLDGNHQTMLYGEGADQIVAATHKFLHGHK